MGIPQICPAQDSSGNQSWTASSQQESPGGVVNPTRRNETHTEADGRVVDRTSVETLGPDGRYVPYSDTEKESHRINDTTVRNIERTFGRDSDGHRTLIQERQEESRSLPGGEQKVTRTISNPDANGGLQVVQREVDAVDLASGAATKLLDLTGNGFSTDDTPLAVHRTFLGRDGAGKAPVEPQKMMLGPCRGGAVRLSPIADVLMVGEGIETCFAAMQATGRPAWAAL